MSDKEQGFPDLSKEEKQKVDLVETTDNEKTPDKLDVMINGTVCEKFMSYGLLMELAKIVKSVEELESMSIETQVEFQEALLATRSKTGQVIGKANSLSNYEITIEDAISLLDWGKRHLYDFFTVQMEKNNKIATKYFPRMLETIKKSMAQKDQVMKLLQDSQS